MYTHAHKTLRNLYNYHNYPYYKTSTKKQKKSFALLKLVIFALTGLLSSCMPRSLPVEVSIDDQQTIYIDIPDKKQYQSILIYTLSVRKKLHNDPHKYDYYWSTHKHVNLVGKSIEEGDKLPIKYGELLMGMVHEKGFEPKKIDNGIYIVRGEVNVFDGREKIAKKIYGEFEYLNGKIENKKTYLTK